MVPSHRLTLFAAIAIASVILGADVASAQYSRGHYVHREGRHHSVERLHWRNGATPVFSNFGTWAVPVAQAIFGGGDDNKSAPEATKDAPSSLATCEHYAVEQQRANDLLARSMALVNHQPPAGGVQGAVPTPGDRPAKPVGDPVLPSEGFGDNPWGVNP